MKVSIVTPSFNQGEFIERTIQSVITQQDVAIEYVVMDGGSKDHTVEILKRYQNHLQWISEPDRGQTHAVNKGIAQTSGEIIGWLNSDDIYYPDAIKRICQFFTEHPDIDVLYGDAYFIDRNDQLIKYYPTEPWNLKRFKSCCYISQPATFFRRTVVTKYGLLNEQLQFCMDYEYWLRLGLQGAKFAYLPQVLAGARLYPETKTCHFYKEATAEAVTMLKQTLNTLPAEWVVRQTGANIRANYGFQYPEVRYIIAVWLALWKTAGLHKQGLSRVTFWVKAQYSMLSSFLRKTFILYEKNRDITVYE